MKFVYFASRKASALKVAHVFYVQTYKRTKSNKTFFGVCK